MLGRRLLLEPMDLQKVCKILKPEEFFWTVLLVMVKPRIPYECDQADIRCSHSSCYSKQWCRCSRAFLRSCLEMTLLLPLPLILLLEKGSHPSCEVAPIE